LLLRVSGKLEISIARLMYIPTSLLFLHRTWGFADVCLENQPKRRFRAQLGQDHAYDLG
jgi:hypothetical protein